MIIIRTLRKDIANYNREDDIVRKQRQLHYFRQSSGKEHPSCL